MKMIFKILLVLYIIIFYPLSWGGVYILATDVGLFMQICALVLGLVLIFFPIMIWILRKDLKKDSR
jgi:hypothetical protein